MGFIIEIRFETREIGVVHRALDQADAAGALAIRSATPSPRPRIPQPEDSRDQADALGFFRVDRIAEQEQFMKIRISKIIFTSRRNHPSYAKC